MCYRNAVIHAPSTMFSFVFRPAKCTMASGIRQTDKCGGPGHTCQIGLPTRRGDLYTLLVKREKNQKRNKRKQWQLFHLNSFSDHDESVAEPNLRRREE